MNKDIEKEADEFFDAIEFSKRKIIKDHESCKCNFAALDWQKETSEWDHHKQYCPVWKNGRIAELEDFLKHVVYLKEEDYDYARDDHMIIRNIIPRIKEMIKSET